MITRDQAMTSQAFHEEHARGAKVIRWRRNGKTQTWKTRPDEFRVPVKYGLYIYDQITHLTAGRYHAEEECPDIAGEAETFYVPRHAAIPPPPRTDPPSYDGTYLDPYAYLPEGRSAEDYCRAEVDVAWYTGVPLALFDVDERYPRAALRVLEVRSRVEGHSPDCYQARPLIPVNAVWN